jgi:hypothetical protein
VVASITPWNSPLYLNVTETVPALLAGNAVILKPAQLTPWSGLELDRIVAEETDIPAGIFQVVVSDDNDVAAQLTSDPRVDMVSFTGSTAVGRKILAAAATTVKKTVMELGGKSTHIVLDDADLAKVLPMAAGGVCTMSGQGCTNATRVLLPRAKLAEGLAILKASMEQFPYGDPWDMKNFSGPAISDVQQAKVLGLIEGAVAAGATLVTGGGKPAHLPVGYYIGDRRRQRRRHLRNDQPARRRPAERPRPPLRRPRLRGVPGAQGDRSASLTGWTAQTRLLLETEAIMINLLFWRRSDGRATEVRLLGKCPGWARRGRSLRDRARRWTRSPRPIARSRARRGWPPSARVAPTWG